MSTLESKGHREDTIDLVMFDLDIVDNTRAVIQGWSS